MPEPVCRYKELYAGAKMVYGRFCRYAGEDGRCSPSGGTVGVELGISGKQARRYIRELDSGASFAVERTDGTGAPYVFLWHAAFDALYRQPLP